MAKDNLLGGNLWQNYSKKVADRMNSPRNFGEITEEDARGWGAKLIVADWGAESCGDAIRLFWAVDEATGKIIKGKFKSFGCGTAIASSDMMIDLCLGKTVDEALQITNIDVEKSLRDDPDTPAVPPQKMHCSVMAYDVIKQAGAIYKGINKEDLEDNDIVCECAQVKLSTVRDAIRINDLTTVQQITDYTKAGGYCKSCIRPGGHEAKKYYLEDILAEVRAEMDREKAAKEEPKEAAFAELNLFRKNKRIEKFFDVEVREMLKQDGGNVEIRDIVEKEGGLEITISFLGACASCAGATKGTFNVIQNLLREKLDESISVIVV